MSNRVFLSPGYYPNPDKSRSLSGAQIFVGIVDLDPTVEANQKQISVIRECGESLEVSQPISTNKGGVPQYNGVPVTITAEGSYSLAVLDSEGEQVYYVPNNTENSGDTVKTIDELRELSGGFQDQSIQALGYYEPGDGGGGPTRIWDEGQIIGFYVDNGGSRIVPTGGDGSAAWLFPEATVANVREFGAVGDGIENDSSAMLKAIEYTVSTGLTGELYFPRGLYNIYTETILLPSFLVIRGESQYSSVIKGTTGSVQMGTSVAEIDSVRSVTLIDIMFDFSGTTNVVINALHIFEFKMERVRVQGGFTCVKLTDVFVATINDCNINGQINPGYSIDTQSFITSLTISKTRSGGRCNIAGSVNGLFLLGSTFESIVAPPLYIEGAQGGLISSYFESGAGIHPLLAIEATTGGIDISGSQFRQDPGQFDQYIVECDGESIHFGANSYSNIDLDGPNILLGSNSSLCEVAPQYSTSDYPTSNLNITDNGTLNKVAGNYWDTLWVGAAEMQSVADLVTRDAGLPSLLFLTGVDLAANILVKLPDDLWKKSRADFKNVAITTVWAADSDMNTTVMREELNVKWLALDDLVNKALDVSLIFTTTGLLTDQFYEHEIRPISNPLIASTEVGYKYAAIQVSRKGANVADTYTGFMNFYGIKIQFRTMAYP